MSLARPLLSLPLLMSVLALGCVDSPDAEDARDDSFLADGKADTGGVTEGSPEAVAVLLVANSSSKSDLTAKVHLASSAASAIEAYRLGDDEQAGTADDEKFETLSELDHVPYVGPVAFGKLLDYAQAQGLVGASASGPSWQLATVANGKAPQYALSPSGELAIAMTDLGNVQLVLASGAVLPQPNIPRTPTSWLSVMGMAFDADNHLHAMFHTSADGVTQHMVLRNGAWQLVEMIPSTVQRIYMRNAPHGEIFALLYTNDWQPLTLATLHADSASTLETLWPLGEKRTMTFTVGNDGYPVLATGPWDAWGVPVYARRGPSGWRKMSAGTESHRVMNLATAGGELASVFVDDYDVTYVKQTGATTWSAEVQTPLAGFSGLAMDGAGTIHTCAGNVHGQIGPQGVTVTDLGDGTEDCWLATDASGTLHMAYHLGTIVNAGTFE